MGLLRGLYGDQKLQKGHRSGGTVCASGSRICQRARFEDLQRKPRLSVTGQCENARAVCGGRSNFTVVDEDCATAVSALSDYIVHVHAKDMLVRSGMNFDPGRGYNLSRGGNYWRGTIFGHGNVPTFQILSAIRKSGYDGYVSLEFEGMEPVLEGVEIGTQNLQHMIEVIGEGQRYV